MASIEKRGENTYRLSSCCGYDEKGHKRFKRKTIKIDNKLTPRQLAKELERQKVLFDEEVAKGTFLDGEKMTFGEYAVKWYNDYAKKHLAVSTLPNYAVRLNERIIPELGHIKLSLLQPHHLEGFYDYLSDDGIRLDYYYSPTTETIELLSSVKTSMCEKVIDISTKTFIRLRKGEKTTASVANKVSKYLAVPLDKAFTVVNKHNQGKLSDKTIKHHHDLISTILSEAKRNNLILNNPAERVRVPKVKKSKLKYYDEKQLLDLFEALKDAPIKYKTVIYFAIDTGLRISEVAGLEWKHINFETKTIQVVQQRQRVAAEYGGVIIKDPKTDSGFRTVTMSPTVTDMLSNYFKYQQDCHLKMGDDWVDSPFVFCHENGEVMSPSRPYQWFVEFTERHKLPKIPFHGLRHTNASLLIAEDTDIVTLSSRLGHGDKNVTLNTYSHIIKSKEQQAANKMDKFYPKPTKVEEDNQ